jgi:transposase-like protein
VLTVVPDLPAALPAEVAAYIGQCAHLRDGEGHRLVVRNGTAEPRTVLTSAGAVEVTAPRDHARAAVKSFAAAYGGKFPKAAAKITEDEDELLAFYDFPAEHWIHLRTTNPIESTFSTVRLRTKVTKGHGSKAAGLAMAFKLIESAQRRWRMVNAPHLVALVRAGAVFVNGKLVERSEDQPAQTPVEAAA